MPTVLMVFSERGFEALGGPTLDGNALATALAGANFQQRSIRRAQGVYGAEELYYQDFLKGVSKDSQVAIGDLALQVLAVQSGGLALTSTGVAELLQKCMADAGAYYEISFATLPAERRDEYHHIEVKVAEPGMVARTRQGYYAEP